jgi:hypothetical protein
MHERDNMVSRSDERDAIFRKVEAAYQNFYQLLKSDGSLPYRSTELGMWATSDINAVYRAFRHFQLNRYNHLADLGSGDGRVVLIASLFTQATGFEIDEWLYQQSLEMLKSLKLTNARFLRQDFHQADLSAYDLLYLYPDKPFYDLEEWLNITWSGHLLAHGPHFAPRHFKKVAESPASVGRFALYESL